MENTGDPCPSDVPGANFWRSVDIYGNHMVRRFEPLGFPLERIDSTSFMAGNAGTIYYRGMHEWKGACLLTGGKSLPRQLIAYNSTAGQPNPFINPSCILSHSHSCSALLFLP